MTREEAIKVLNMVESHGLADEAKKMAIKALSQEEQSEWERDHEILKAYADGQESMKPCKDAISRQAVINILDDMVKDYVKENDFDKAQGIAWVKVQRLPSVTTRQKVGRWEDCSIGWMCSNCGATKLNDSNYCPNCGAKMKGVKE